MEKSYLSKERHEELVKELEYLKNEKRQEIATRLREAKALGDLSENAEYHEARDDKVQLDQRINNLENILRNAEIIKNSGKKDKVRVGSQVDVEGKGIKATYTIVGSNETDPGRGKISNESPLGKSLLGGKVGDKVVLKTPKGEQELKIKKIN